MTDTDEVATAPGRRLAPTSAMLAVGFAALAAVIATTGNALALSIAVAGVAAVALGLPSRSHFWCAFGTLVLAASVVVAVLAGHTGWRPVTGVTLAILAWDRADHAITVGGQVGSDGTSHRAELRQAAVPAGVGLAAIALPLAVVRVQLPLPVVPLAVLLAAAVLLLSATRV